MPVVHKAGSAPAGEGATYAIVPLVKRRVSEQVASLVGAYGNVGALCFLTLLLVASPTMFFLSIAATAVLAAGVSLALPEPSGADHDAAPVAQDVRGQRATAAGSGGPNHHVAVGRAQQQLP